MSKERVLEEMARQNVDVLLLGREGNARYVSGAHRLFLAGERAFAPGCVVVRESAAVHLLSVTDFGIPQAVPHDNLYPISWNPAATVEGSTPSPMLTRKLNCMYGRSRSAMTCSPQMTGRAPSTPCGRR